MIEKPKIEIEKPKIVIEKPQIVIEKPKIVIEKPKIEIEGNARETIVRKSPQLSHSRVRNAVKPK